MAQPRVLISDALSPAAVSLFGARGIATDFRPDLGKNREALADMIGKYDGLAVRSTTKVTSKLLERAGALKIIGRAGSGVDNIDVPAATARGVVVMNTPFGNSITTAEHTIAMMFALARLIPAATASTRAGKWEKGKFLGVELTGKCLGIIGCGAIGAIVADRAIGLRMRVIASDPFLSPERALQIGVEKVALDELLARADIISLHTPLTALTRNVLSAEALAATRPGIRIINCARGGLLDEAALEEMLDAGHVAGAALDVLADETNVTSRLLTHPKVVCTPHLGASTFEAQENVALQVAEQMADYLSRGAIANAINVPSISAEEAPKLRPFVALADKLGAFAGALIDGAVARVRIIYEGEIAERKTTALSAALIAGLLRHAMPTINVVSAPSVARDRGIVVDEVVRASHADYESLITLEVEAGAATHTLVGTVFHDGKARIVDIDGIGLDAPLAARMLFVRNEDRPGFIGRLASAIGAAGLNIATFALGRNHEGGHAVALVALDGEISDGMATQLARLDGVRDIKVLRFAG